MLYVQLILLFINITLLVLIVFVCLKMFIKKRKYKIFLKAEVSNNIEKETNKETRTLEITVINKTPAEFTIQGLGLYFKHHTINFIDKSYIIQSNEVFRISIDVNKIIDMLKNQPSISFKNMRYYLKNDMNNLILVKSKHLLHFIREKYTL